MPSKILLSMFERQFTRAGDGFIYRMSFRGPPIRVTPSERDAFIARFKRDYFLLLLAGFGGIGGTILLAAKAGYLGNDVDPTILWFWIVGLAALTIGLISWGSFRIWRAPARILSCRGPD